jgi:hypothetical protein
MAPPASQEAVEVAPPQTRGENMHRILIALVLSLIAVNASAATCKNQASDKSLAGAMLSDFLGQCERDARASCEANADVRGLSGDARTTFTQKCVSDAIGE